MTIGSQDKDNSHIAVNQESTAFVGQDATKLYSATCVMIGLRTYAKFGRSLNRAYTPTNMLAFASGITKQKYSKTKDGYLLAAADLKVWCDAMKAALPIVEG
jgi:hypothetical protein